MVDAFTGARPLLRELRVAGVNGHRVASSTPVMFEWLRGPRVDVELQLQRELCPADRIVAFGGAEAAVAASIYKNLKRARGREMDIAIAACAIEQGASLWTVNPADFKDIPALQLYVAPRRPFA
jgi:predicted nucleic acid-binding protein